MNVMKTLPSVRFILLAGLSLNPAQLLALGRRHWGALLGLCLAVGTPSALADVVLTCPPNTNVDCAASAPAPATDSNGFTNQGGTITDNGAGTSWTVTSTDAISASNCPNQFVI